MDVANLIPALLLSLILTAFFTAIISAALLALYRRRVLHFMNEQAPIKEVAPSIETDNSPLATENAFPLEFVLINEQTPAPNPKADTFYEKLKIRAKRRVIVYTLAGLGYALVMAVSTFIANRGLIDFALSSFLVTLWLFFFPVLFSLDLALFYDQNLRRWIPIIYFLIYFITIFIAAVPRWDDMLAGFTSFIWINAFPFILTLVFLSKRTKAIAPLIMSFVFFAITGIVLAFLYGLEPLANTIIHSEHWLVKTFISLTRIIHPNALVPASMLLLLLVGLILIGSGGIFLLRSIRRGYKRKKLSDQSLLIDAIWLNFALIQTIMLEPNKPQWIFAGLVAFLAYKLLTIIGFRLTKEKDSPEHTPQLLFLRVFSLGRKSQRLYQAINALWRLGGNTLFITGPDLLTSTVEPHDFLDFLGNKLKQRFTDSAETLNRQIDSMDTLPDHDRSYRIHDFFCYDSTWKIALHRLTQESEVILMDLRSFSAQNAGCTFEINELINHVYLEQIIFLFDQSTDKSHMFETMRNAWGKMQPASPNAMQAGRIQLFDYSSRDLQHLLKAVIGSAIRL